MESEKFISEMAVLGKNMEQDVVEQILSILPPKPLMRFKRVSKQWYALINSHRFVARHLSNSNSNSMHNTTLVLLKRLKLNDANTDQTEELFSLLKFCNDSDNNDEHGFLASSEDVNIPVHMSLKTRGESLCVIGHCNGIICLAMANSCEVLLWNLATEEFKLLPTLPYLPDSRPREDWPPWSPQEAWWRYKDALGFGYCPKSNDYKVVNVHIGFSDYEEFDNIYIYFPPTAALYTLGTDSWREAKSYYLETETTLLWPEKFQMCFKGVCYWLGQEQHKELLVYDWMVERFIRGMIILFDLGDEVFHAMLLPDSLYIYDPIVYCYNTRLLLWNESIALIGVHNIGSGHSTGSHFCFSFGIWVMDEVGWTKHVTYELFDEKPLTFLKSDEILMADANGCLFSYNVGTKNLNYLPIQRVSNDSATVVYVDSIVSLLGGNKLETGDNSTNADFSLYKCPSFSNSIADKHCHSYSVWAIPSEDTSLRIKKVMEGLRTEFAGPKIDPHIPVVGSIRMTHDEVLNKFRSLRSLVIYSYKAKVNEVVTRNFYYQCVSLLIDYSCSTVSQKLWDATGQCRAHFGFDIEHRPHLSLLFGNLTIEERKLAQEKVSSMDESITSLSFPITRLALYKINYKDTTLKSWEKIAEYPLLFNN